MDWTDFIGKKVNIITVNKHYAGVKIDAIDDIEQEDFLIFTTKSFLTNDTKKVYLDVRKIFSCS